MDPNHVHTFVFCFTLPHMQHIQHYVLQDISYYNVEFIVTQPHVPHSSAKLSANIYYGTTLHDCIMCMHVVVLKVPIHCQYIYTPMPLLANLIILCSDTYKHNNKHAIHTTHTHVRMHAHTHTHSKTDMQHMLL